MRPRLFFGAVTNDDARGSPHNSDDDTFSQDGEGGGPGNLLHTTDDDTPSQSSGDVGHNVYSQDGDVAIRRHRRGLGRDGGGRDGGGRGRGRENWAAYSVEIEERLRSQADRAARSRNDRPAHPSFPSPRNVEMGGPSSSQDIPGHQQDPLVHACVHGDQATVQELLSGVGISDDPQNAVAARREGIESIEQAKRNLPPLAFTNPTVSNNIIRMLDARLEQLEREKREEELAASHTGGTSGNILHHVRSPTGSTPAPPTPP